IQTTTAVAATAMGTSQPNAGDRHHLRCAGGGVARTIAASSAWQRAHAAACDSAAVRSRALSVPSAHAASVSASRHGAAGSGANAPRSASRNNRGGTSLIDDLIQIQRTWIVGHRREARGDLIVAQPRLVPELPLDLSPDRETRPRQLARRGRFAL